VFHLGLCHSWPRFVPLSSGSRLVKALGVSARLVRGGSSAALLFSMPRVALLTETASPAFPVVTVVVTDCASILVPPVGSGGGSVEVLHLDRQGLKLLEGGDSAQTLKDDAQSFWLDEANILEFLSLFGEDIATSLSYLIKFIVEFTDVIPALQVL
jgi:hypothetical protein